MLELKYYLSICNYNCLTVLLLYLDALTGYNQITVD